MLNVNSGTVAVVTSVTSNDVTSAKSHNLDQREESMRTDYVVRKSFKKLAKGRFIVGCLAGSLIWGGNAYKCIC
jgi:hypothetical protein